MEMKALSSATATTAAAAASIIIIIIIIIIGTTFLWAARVGYLTSLGVVCSIEEGILVHGLHLDVSACCEPPPSRLSKRPQSQIVSKNV